MPQLALFWKLLETRPDRTAVISEWQRVSDDRMDSVRRLLLLHERSASTYPNPHPAGQPLKIVRHANGAIVAVDDTDYENRLELTDEDIGLYQLNLASLRSMLCDTLDSVNIAKTPIDQNGRMLQIGNWEPRKSASFPVYLLLCMQSKMLREQLLKLQSSFTRGGALLLTPSRLHWTDAICDLARKQKMLMVSLDEVIEPRSDGFMETPAWEEYMQAFAQMIKMTLPGNYRQKKPLAKRAELMAKAEKVKVALLEHIRSSRDGVVANLDAGKGATLVKFLTKTELANLAGLEPHNITRCFRADPQLKILYEIANDPEEILRYGK